MPQIAFDQEIDHDSAWVEFDRYPDAPLHFNRVNPDKAPERDACGTILKSVGLNFFDKGATPPFDFVLSIAHRAAKGLRNLGVHEQSRLADLEPFRLARSWYAKIEEHRAFWFKNKRYTRRDNWNDSQKRDRERRIIETERLRLLGMTQQQIADILGMGIRTVKDYCAALAARYGKNWLAVAERIKAKSSRRIHKAKQAVSESISLGATLLHGECTMRQESLETPVESEHGKQIRELEGEIEEHNAQFEQPIDSRGTAIVHFPCVKCGIREMLCYAKKCLQCLKGSVAPQFAAKPEPIFEPDTPEWVAAVYGV